MAYSSYLTLAIPALVTLAVTYVAMLFVREYMLESGVTFVNLNVKKGKVTPSGGGVAVAFGFVIGMLTYVFGASFGFYKPAATLETLFGVVLSILLIAFVGFIDDINVKTKQVKTTGMRDYRKGLKQWQKPVLTFVGAIPMMAINAGVSTIAFPVIGAINLGLLYPLIIIPLAIIFAANAFNLLGGFDGMISGAGLIATLGLFVYSLIWGTYNGAIVTIVLAAAMFIFFLFHKYPIKILPGDSFTYLVGAALVDAMIVGNMEIFGIVVFAPWILEFIFHLRGRFKTTDLGVLQKDGTLLPPYGRKIYSWTHIIMNLKKCREWQVAQYMWLVELGFVALAFGLKLFVFP